MKLGIGIDTGGTYTDAVLCDLEKNEVIAKGKALTTKGNLQTGILNALAALPDGLLKQARVISLSTTLATNACVENKGGRAKLVLLGTTRETLKWIGAKARYGLNEEDVLCIDTKSSFDGTAVDHPDWDETAEREREWFSDAQALAVAEVNALRNGAAVEKRAREKLGEKFPVPLVMASEIAGELNFIERGSTALLNARLMPVVKEFMEAVAAALKKRGIEAREMIVRSDGSLMSEDMALKHPVKTILSGPAASVIGARSLSRLKNALIVDMGGTTTDISVVRADRPLTTSGIRIGGYRTQIQGVFIDTFALGGDSRVTVENGRPALDDRRVQPLCVAAQDHPEIKRALEELLQSGKAGTLPLHEFLYLVRRPPASHNYSDYELRLIDALKAGPVMLGSGRIDVYNLKSARLEREGVVMRCGLTPTDIMHILGDFDRFDKAASVLGAKFLLKQTPQFGKGEQGLARLCQAVYDLVCKKLYRNIVRILLSQQYPRVFDRGVDAQMAALIDLGFEQKLGGELLGLRLDTRAGLIGIGAPTHIFLPRVAQILGAECVIPPHAEVANAVGAISADITARARVSISPVYTTEGVAGYTVYAAREREKFDRLEAAVEFARAQARKEAVARAREQGALGELRVDTRVNANSAGDREGAVIDLGTTVEAVATGRV